MNEGLGFAPALFLSQTQETNMASPNPSVAVTPVFYTEVVEDVNATREAGRPIMVEEDRVEYRIAGNRNFAPHFLAHEFHERVQGEDITHAMRWPAEYKRFKETGGNVAKGTPLQNLPGLTPVQTSTLKALSVFSIEALAGIEGRELKNLGPGGHEMKRAAQQFLDAAGGRLGMNEVMQEIAALRAQNDELSRIVGIQKPAPVEAEHVEHIDAPDPYAELSDEDLKAKIKEKTGSGVRGPTPDRAVLIGMLKDLEAA